ncbi:MAG: prolyl oligopeptidase family serine peptidase [Proteobacteria bacterium]|jgi:predicted esterase|nr:prolyl oligopeptidase family serine peptidase [Pseudomonadota bacterium]
MKTIILFFIFSTSFSWASNCVEQRNERGELSWIHCPHKEVTLFKGTLDQREVLWSLPQGEPPQKGWPVVILSQGSWFPVEFSRPSGLPLGGFNEVRLIQALLDQGFAVIAPRATLHVGWITNMPHGEYKKRADYKVIAEVLSRVKTGFWGELNPAALFATGISSGGYHTSRLALSFPGQFQAIAIQSASYATCLGPLCQMPKNIPRSHPPTLFLHGARDLTVPLYTAQQFHDLLQDRGIETQMVINPEMGHGWLEEAPEAIVEWFVRYLRR